MKTNLVIRYNILTYSKAFDCFKNADPVQDLYKSGFRYHLLSWIRSYLANKTQWIKTNSQRLVDIEAPSGVPNGCYLKLLILAYS